MLQQYANYFFPLLFLLLNVRGVTFLTFLGKEFQNGNFILSKKQEWQILQKETSFQQFIVESLS